MKNLILIFFILTSFSIFSQNAENALSFDGTNDYVTCALPNLFSDISNNDFTVETWVKVNGSGTQRIFFAQSSTSEFASILLTGSNAPYFYVFSGTQQGVLSNTNLVTGQWHHLVCTWNASLGLANIYIDGVLTTGGSSGISSTGTNNVMTIGARTDGNQLFNGELDEFAIWNKQFNQCAVNSAMLSEYTAMQPDLIAYYNFNEGIAGSNNTGVTNLPDLSTNYSGTLLNFDLNGTVSNWVASGAGITLENDLGGYQTTDVISACASYEWINGVTYTSNNNIATFTMIAVNGCDSIISLDLTILEPVEVADEITACKSYTWIDGNTYFSNNNSAQYIETAQNGCDSIITLNLTIENVNVTVNQLGDVILQAAYSTADSYQWVDCNDNYTPLSGFTMSQFTATQNGTYAVIIEDNDCVDTSNCFVIDKVDLVDDFSLQVKVYPNPTSAVLNINVEQGLVSPFVVIDALGRIVYEDEIDKNLYSIDFTFLDKGTYTIVFDDVRISPVSFVKN